MPNERGAVRVVEREPTGALGGPSSCVLMPCGSGRLYVYTAWSRGKRNKVDTSKSRYGARQRDLYGRERVLNSAKWHAGRSHERLVHPESDASARQGHESDPFSSS